MRGVGHLLGRVKQQASAARTETLVDKAARIRAKLFPQQVNFIDDEDRFKALLCPRRAGKTFAAAAYLMTRCLTQREARTIYITMTRGVAKRNLWAPLKSLNDAFSCGARWHNTELIGTFPNGSTVQLAGAETLADIDKFRGTAYDLILLDECKSFPADLLTELVEEVLEPTLNDRLGTLGMMGTPGAILAGRFFDATCDQALLVRATEEGGRRVESRPYELRDAAEYQDATFKWSFHRWGIADNTAMPEMWERSLATKRRNGWSDEDPRWIREYLGRWLADDAAFVFRYKEERNGWRPNPTKDNPYGLPEGDDWQFVAGVDLGYDDDFDIEVFAYSDTHPDLFHVYGFASPGLTISDIAKRIKETEALFGSFEIIVGDRAGLGKTIFASLDETYGIHIEPAEKQEKRDHIELFNSDLVNGRIKILIGSTLERQMMINQWDETGLKEDKRAFANHATDAAVYIWRYAYHHFARKPVELPKRGTAAWQNWLMEEQARKIVEQREMAHRLDPYDDGRPLDEGPAIDWREYLQ